MKRLTGVSVVTVAEGKRVAYQYTRLSEDGTILTANNKGSFLALDDELLTAISKLESVAQARMEVQP